MSLFDKISGLASKAKENVVSKTFLSKDRRLEQTLSQHIDRNDIYFEKVSTYGMPSTVGVVAFDCVAGLLAVAGDSNRSYVKVFGKGISATIDIPNSEGIKYMQFRTGYPILILIDKSNTLITVDLRTKSIRHTLKAHEIITCQAYCEGTDWLFVGYANGFVDVFDIMQGLFAPYQIPDLLDTESPENQQNDHLEKHVVVDLQLHPTELNTLLVGYDSAVFLWNIKEATIRRTFSLRRLDRSSPYRTANLTCLVWSPNGTRFMAGYDDGCVHLWDIKHEHKPIASRRLSETFLHVSEDPSQPAEPVYQMAWYLNTAYNRSYLVVAGGLNPTDIQGLNVLEFDLNCELREPKKQTIMPLPTDLSHFVVMNKDPYHMRMVDPFAIAIIGSDHCLRVLSLDHGFPSLQLPPALEFLSPFILSACHIPHVSENVFQKLTVIDTKHSIHYVPLTGGVAGPDHIYRIESNDLLITIHQGEVIKFWDASFTALRPLVDLSIHCLTDLEDSSAFLCCLDVNKETGMLSVGFSNGSILIYNHHSPVQEPPVPGSKNQEFINNCDDTLKEISDLLDDMNSEPDTENHEPVSAPTGDIEQPNMMMNPFESVQTNEKELPDVPTTQSSKVPEPLPKTTSHSSKFRNISKANKDSFGYFASLSINLGKSPITSMMSVNSSILVTASEDGKFYVLDIQEQSVLFWLNISQMDYQNHAPSQTNPPKHEAQPNTPEPPKFPQKEPASITSLYHFDTYKASKVMEISTQIFVGLSNGHIYQFDLFCLIDRGMSLLTSCDKLNDYKVLHLHSGLQNMSAVDLSGSLLSSSTEAKHEIPTKDSNGSVLDDSSKLGSTQEGQPLTKKSSYHSITTVSTASIASDPVEGNANISRANSNASANSNSSGAIASKRMLAIGKGEYRQQENPHFLLCVTQTGISIVLSGYNVKLFSRDFPKDVKPIRSEVVKSKGSVCLVVLLDTGKLVFYSLPTLEVIAETNLPDTCELKRLSESSLSTDGRIIFWTGKYEMKQYSFVHKPHLALGESVILFDSHIVPPPHPSTLVQQQKPKKSWFDAVAGAFQKEALTVTELDLLMGRVPMEDPNEVRKQKVEAYKAKMQNESNSSKGPGGVFSQLGEKMNERGEKLNEMEQKFSELNSASGDFLKAVREYNERQARKKWWEF